MPGTVCREAAHGGSSPAGYPAEPLVSYQINRQLSGSSSTSDSRVRGALPKGDVVGRAKNGRGRQLRRPTSLLTPSWIGSLVRSPRWGRFLCRHTPAGSLFGDKLFGPAALYASETDEVWFGLADFMPGQSHDRATAKAGGIFAGVERVKQVFLIAGHSSAPSEGQKHRRPSAAWPSSALSRSSQNSVAG
jgi:hypothetical protein